MKDNYKKALSKTIDTPYFVKEVEFKDEDISFMPISKINEIRRQMLYELSLKILSRYKTKQQKPLEIADFPIATDDYRMNIHNKKALEFMNLCNCKIKEMSFEKRIPKAAELMRMRHCLKRVFFNCKYDKDLFLEDEKQARYKLEFDCKNCEMIILKP